MTGPGFKCPHCGEVVGHWAKVPHLVQRHGYAPPGTWTKEETLK